VGGILKYIYPFSAIVGQELMKKALVLNVIDPSIGGVLIRGEKGTAKSTAVRALAELLPEQKVVKNCKFNCSPDDISNFCAECKESYLKNNSLDFIFKKIKVVNLPVGATEDRVIGTIDIEKVLKDGSKFFEPGILAEANRGILYIDEVNLLNDHIVDVILDAAAMGENYIEREGISFSHPSRFVLIGTMNPEEGELRPQLLDRFGLCVEVKGIKNIDNRIEVIKRRREFEESPKEFIDKWKKEDLKLQESILLAQKILPNVKISELCLRIIAQIAIDLNVDGHRADIIMEKTSKAFAAFYGEYEVNEKHIREAAKIVLPHRMRKNPFEDMEVEYDIVESSIQKIKSTSNSSTKNSQLINSEKKK
jgi:magnesium chelatase subunit D